MLQLHLSKLLLEFFVFANLRQIALVSFLKALNNFIVLVSHILVSHLPLWCLVIFLLKKLFPFCFYLPFVFFQLLYLTFIALLLYSTHLKPIFASIQAFKFLIDIHLLVLFLVLLFDRAISIVHFTACAPCLWSRGNECWFLLSRWLIIFNRWVGVLLVDLRLYSADDLVILVIIRLRDVDVIRVLLHLIEFPLLS